MINLTRDELSENLEKNSIIILPPLDVFQSFDLVRSLKFHFSTIMLDPWYNKGVGGVINEYDSFLMKLMTCCLTLTDHFFLWGFPEIIASVINKIPIPFQFTCWLTWYYKNNPSVIRGWRSAQQTCLHISLPSAKMYPEHFLNDKQLELKKQGKLRYMPGPPSVIEVPLNIGFIRKNEQTGHPSQKPEAVYEPLFKMTTVYGDFVFDPMAGAGTTGALCQKLGYKAILCDISEEYTQIMEKRLNIKRITI